MCPYAGMGSLFAETLSLSYNPSTVKVVNKDIFDKFMFIYAETFNSDIYQEYKVVLYKIYKYEYQTLNNIFDIYD